MKGSIALWERLCGLLWESLPPHLSAFQQDPCPMQISKRFTEVVLFRPLPEPPPHAFCLSSSQPASDGRGRPLQSGLLGL